jgi:hypothetical protein
MTVEDTLYRALQPILADEDLANLLVYMNDYVHLALTCRHLRDHALYLEFYVYLVEEAKEAKLEAYIQQRALYEECGSSAERLCESCGMRPGMEWLSWVECQDCYADHTD